MRRYSRSTQTGIPGCSQGGGLARPWLQTGFLVHAEHLSHTPRGRVYKVTMSCTWAAKAAFRGPRGTATDDRATVSAFVVRQHPMDRLRRDRRRHHPAAYQLPALHSPTAEVHDARLDSTEGSEQAGIGPVVIVSWMLLMPPVPLSSRRAVSTYRPGRRLYSSQIPLLPRLMAASTWIQSPSASKFARKDQ